MSAKCGDWTTGFIELQPILGLRQIQLCEKFRASSYLTTWTVGIGLFILWIASFASRMSKQICTPQSFFGTTTIGDTYSVLSL